MKLSNQYNKKNNKYDLIKNNVILYYFFLMNLNILH